MKVKELRNKSTDELDTLVRQWRETLRSLRFGITSGSIRTVRQIRQTRKDLAKALTIIKEKQQGKSTRI